MRGLSSEAAKEALFEHGPNALPPPKTTPLALRLLRQLKSPLIYVLLAALAFDVGHWAIDGGRGVPAEALFIFLVLAINAGLGAYQEVRSEKAITRLRALAAPHVWAFRDGELVRVPTGDLVPGDVARVGAGERVPADGVAADARGLMLDESALTGESVPVEKADGSDLQSGTLVVRGHTLLEITRTGPASTMGKLAKMLEDMEVEKTPLERRLAHLGHRIAQATAAICIVLAVLGVAALGFGRFDEVLLLAVALAVAAVPEGMPAVVTLTLAMGVTRMARRKAVVRRLSAVEALGSVTVIVTDKTGTLTESRMRVEEIEAIDREALLLSMVLASDADVGGAAGDPLEIGMLAYASAAGFDVARARAERPRVSSRAFDSAWKFMRVTTRGPSGVESHLKGAPEAILARVRLSDADRGAWTDKAERAASSGYRIIAFARGPGEREEALELVGLAYLWDPPRATVAGAIATAKRAGVRVVMATGDHPGTARAVATAAGIPAEDVITGPEIDRLSQAELALRVKTTSVLARVSPEHKLRLVDALKTDGEIVAMLGDGINDAPALKRSDVGVAMGTRGSDVAREVSDMVLLDDDLTTIVSAIEEGRGIYENIQAFLRYTFLTNVSLVLLMAAGSIGSYVVGLREPGGMLLVPLTALQMLWINFLGDGPPALALGLDRMSGLMNQPPRPPKSPILDRESMRFVVATGAFKGTLSIAMLLVYPLAGYGMVAARTAIFLYESVGKLVSAYPARGRGRKPNIALHAFVLLGVGIQALAVGFAPLRRVLRLDLLDARGIAMLGGGVVLTWAFGSVMARIFLARREGDSRPSPPLDESTRAERGEAAISNA